MIYTIGLAGYHQFPVIYQICKAGFDVKFKFYHSLQLLQYKINGFSICRQLSSLPRPLIKHNQFIIFYFSDRCATPEGAIVIGKRKTIVAKSQLFDGESEKTSLELCSINRKHIVVVIDMISEEVT